LKERYGNIYYRRSVSQSICTEF